MNKLSTKRKLVFLQNYIRNWHKEWRQNNVDNIVGFRIGKKTSNGIRSRYYSIIFQVNEKKNENQLESNSIIPKSYLIEFEDKKKRRIKTDVEETGTFNFHFGITGEVQSIYSNSFGSAGLFVTDRADRVFMLTNYHVVAIHLINKNQYYYRRPDNQNDNDVTITLNDGHVINGRFEEGLISHQVDAAFVELFGQPENHLNMLPDENRVNGRVSARPIPRTFIGKKVIIYSRFNPHGESGIINNNSSILYTSNSDIYFEDVIQIHPKVTRKGDSGGAVVTPSFSILGIIVGGDNKYSYAIPFYKINDFKNIFII